MFTISVFVPPCMWTHLLFIVCSRSVHCCSSGCSHCLEQCFLIWLSSYSRFTSYMITIQRLSSVHCWFASVLQGDFIVCDICVPFPLVLYDDRVMSVHTFLLMLFKSNLSSDLCSLLLCSRDILDVDSCEFRQEINCGNNLHLFDNYGCWIVWTLCNKWSLFKWCPFK